MKADAYGLGADAIVAVLIAEGCNEFFVAQLEEGILLRKAFPSITIYVLNGAELKTEQMLAHYKLIPVLNDPGQIDRWINLGHTVDKKLPAALHIDTGINRLGLTQNEFDDLLSRPSYLKNCRIILCLSHLACADDPINPKNQEQLNKFLAIRQRFPHGRASLANSSGIFLGSKYHFDLARPGIGLYGGNPFPGKPNPMRPAVQFQGRIIQVRIIDAAETVGYGATYKTRKKTKIATVAAGYADGLLRSNVKDACVIINDVEAPIVGRVSMDMITVNIDKIPNHLAHPGTLVDLLSDRWTIEHMADAAGTISNEILTGLGRRGKRVYLQH